jgi:hypothetical protein
MSIDAMIIDRLACDRQVFWVYGRYRPDAIPASCPRSILSRQWASSRCPAITPTATFAELQAFCAKAIEMGLPSLATAALIGWEWLQREIDIFATFEIGHYRPKKRPNAVRVSHQKTGEGNWSTTSERRSIRNSPPNSTRSRRSASPAHANAAFPHEVEHIATMMTPITYLEVGAISSLLPRGPVL